MVRLQPVKTAASLLVLARTALSIQKWKEYRRIHILPAFQLFIRCILRNFFPKPLNTAAASGTVYLNQRITEEADTEILTIERVEQDESGRVDNGDTG